MDERTMDARTSGGLTGPERSATGGTLLLGVLWTITGVLCLAATGVASVAAVYYVGIVLAVGGLLSLIWGFRGAGSAAVVLGILSLVVGILMFARPGVGLESLTLLLIGYFFIAGLFRVVTSLIDRLPGWGFACISGLCAIAIGVISVRAWPVSNFWLLGTLVGVELLIRGISMVAAAASARRVLRKVRGAA